MSLHMSLPQVIKYGMEPLWPHVVKYMEDVETTVAKYEPLLLTGAKLDVTPNQMKHYQSKELPVLSIVTYDSWRKSALGVHTDTWQFRVRCRSPQTSSPPPFPWQLFLTSLLHQRHGTLRHSLPGLPPFHVDAPSLSPWRHALPPSMSTCPPSLPPALRWQLSRMTPTTRRATTTTRATS